MPHATLIKFGHPATLIRDYAHWSVLLRPAQVTLGALVLCARSEARSFASLPAGAFGELAIVTRHIEDGLRAFEAYGKLNYLMLMMVDPHVHFHVLPRYAAPRTWDGLDFEDRGWPGPPDLASGLKPDAAQLAKLRDAVAAVWPAA